MTCVEASPGMNFVRLILSGASWLCIAVTALLLPGCAGGTPGQWNGLYAIDSVGGARTCVASTAAPADGTSVIAQIQMSNEGGWCGITVNRGGVPYDSYLLVTRPDHGKIFAHRVGKNTRVDYTPDPGFSGADRFAVRLIPGDAVLGGAVTVTR